jgi:hypothetical protein
VSRILHHHASPVRLAGGRALAAVSAAFLAIAIAACGSSSSSTSHAATSAVLGTTLQQDCTAIGDVLANGPDPDSDAVGYAEAQVLPLRQLKIGDVTLQRDVLTLATAYQAVSAGGGATAATAVTKATKAVSSICPQAAS